MYSIRNGIISNFLVFVCGGWLLGYAEAQIQTYHASPYLRDIRMQIQTRPTVSPYVNLVFNGPTTQSIGGVAPTYQTLVRPQVQAREELLGQQRQLQMLQQQVQDIRSDFKTGENGQIATGHPTRYRTHSHYYPQLDVVR